MGAAEDGQNKAEPSDLKRKLAWRMGFAGLMIVMLLGALVLFDRLGAPDESEPAAPRFSDPVPVQQKEMTQPVKPADAPPAEERKAAESEESAVPIDKSVPPPRPEVASQPSLPKTGARPLSPGRPLDAEQSTTQAATQAVPPPAAQRAVPAARTDAPGVVIRQAPPVPRLLSGYALQAGVFSDPRRAEELHARLTLNGIPSSIEARVQVGPFKSREEAEAAHEKMRALGIDAVLLPPRAAVRR